MRIAIIDPPGTKVVMRDMYSSTISKLGYSWPNVDLLSISSIINEGHECKIFDFNSKKISSEKAIKKIQKYKPDHIIISYGESSKKEDLKFAKLLKQQIVQGHGKVLGTGGSLAKNPEKYLREHVWLDGVITNYVLNECIEFLSNKKNSINIAFIDENKKFRHVKKELKNNFILKIGNHKDLNSEIYFLPQISTDKLTTISTSWGCPYKCSYCVSATLNYSFRSAQSIFDEISDCYKRGINGFFFRDNVFGINKKQTRELADLIEKNDLKIQYVTDARIDYIDDETIKHLIRIGKPSLNFGIESKNKQTLTNYCKGLKHDRIKEVISKCKKNNITTTGYFILGLPGESEKDVLDTIEYSTKIGLDFASYNLPIPIEGTKFREQSIKQGLVNDTTSGYDGSGIGTIKNPLISSQTLIKLHKKAYLKFYFRPIIIVNILRNNFKIRRLTKMLSTAIRIITK